MEGSQRARESAHQHALEISRERLRLISRITGRIVGTEPLTRQAQAMAEEVRAIFSMDACVIRLLEDQSLVLLAAVGVPEEHLHERLPLDIGISREIIALRRPVFIPDVRQHPTIAKSLNRSRRPIVFTSYAGTPLVMGEDVVGIFGIYSSQECADFTDADLNYLQILGNNMTVAIVNDRLYAELKRQRDQLKAEIGERLRAEQALRESEERYRQVVEDQTEFVVRWRPDGARTFVNSSYCRYFQKTPEEMLGGDFFELVAEQDREAVEHKIATLTPDNPVQTDEHRVVLPDGRTGWNEWTDRALFDDQGRLVEFQSVGRDITERKRLQDQLVQARKMESVGTLAGGIAHDFGNVLAVILGNVSMLQRQPNLPSRIREMLAEIATAAERGSAFTQQLLAYAHGRTRQQAPTNLNDLLRATVTGGLQRLKPDDVRIDLRLGEDTPTIMADGSQIEQVILNLGLNALEASPPAGRVEIATGRAILNGDEARNLELSPGEYALLTCKDAGPGIRAEHLERIFEPFFSTKPMGRGMGLATSLAIVRDHHGQIHVESTERDGTTVYVWLPALRPSGESRDQPAE